MTGRSDKRPPCKDYEVGYGKPPLSGRFVKGVSGNPRGRPKKARPASPQPDTSARDRFLAEADRMGADAILASNFVFWLSFVLAGFGAYLLGWELTQNRGAALVCALAFAFAPYRFGHLGHLQMQTAHFMPLVAALP
ncbi:MAG: hypothetical protein HC909_04470, partial [Blastochloris sp.]|nr:hypothetical protein [Blastochloris sp.]